MTLIERLERGPGSRELSDECLLAVGWTSVPSAFKDWSDIYLMPNGDAWNMRTMGNRPDPSQNLQDALDWMVPEGWEWTLHVSKSGCVVNLCREWNNDSAPVYWSNQPDKSERGGHYKRRIGSPPTPALALVIAGQRAREAMKEKDDVL